ncbi:MAG: ROK family protein [Gammaproteobacteria bacterium]|nr:ROK family protein [Gammaproteobacteria bacterium]
MRIGIDLGGTKIEGIALEDNGQIPIRERVPTPSHDYNEIVNSIAGLVQSIEQQYGDTGTVGIGIPGSASVKTGLIRNANTVCLIGNDLQGDLETLLKRPIRMANDADCFALSEASDGAGTNSNSVFGVIIGTGCGSGIVINKQLVEGANRIAGEWGHNPLPWPRDTERPGAACYCGQLGCLETWLSGTGFARTYHETGGSKISAKEVMQRVSQGEQLAIDMLDQYIDRMARSLAVIINIIDPATIVLGGGMSHVSQLYTEVPKHWDKYIFSPEPAATELKPPVHGDSGGVRGAAWLWPL